MTVCGDGKIVATKYHSTKTVHLLSTGHGHTQHAIKDRRKRVISTAHTVLLGLDCAIHSASWTTTPNLCTGSELVQ